VTTAEGHRDLQLYSSTTRFFTRRQSQNLLPRISKRTDGMEPSPVAVESTATASDLALKSKTALLEAVEDVTYGSVRYPI
jgi:hypothetical protein